MQDLTGDLCIGVDVGATNTRAAVVDQEAKILAVGRRPTHRGNRSGILQGLLSAIEEVLIISGVSQEQIIGVGVGIPGTVDIFTGRFVRSSNLAVEDIPVRSAVEQEFDLPCWVENDVRAATIGELIFGAGRQFKDFVYLSVGTGIAAGLIFDGRIYRGAAHRAGEFGHVTVDLHGIPQRRRKLETWVAGPGIVWQAQAMAEAYPQSSLVALMRGDPDALNATAIFQAAADGDELGLRVLDEVSEYLGVGVVNLFSLLSPQVIILGGGVFSQADILVERLRAIVEPVVERRKRYYGLPHGIALSRLGPANVGMIGAASLVRYFTQVEIIGS